jgi:formamidopyrimidine-DNA glycosylase
MTGCLLVTPPDYPIEKHTHIIMRLNSGMEQCFSDTLRFGRFWLIQSGKKDTYSGISKLGLELLSDECNAQYLKSKFGKRKKEIKECLLDQSVIVGIGNIYSDEILFRAKICPTRPADSLMVREWERLAEMIPERLLQVYGHAGEPCPNCGETLVRVVISGRSSVYCPNCQE